MDLKGITTLSLVNKCKFLLLKDVQYVIPTHNYLITGRDASLAFITGEFDNNGLTDDISSLSIQQVKALNDWVQFYNTNYIYKGMKLQLLKLLQSLEAVNLFFSIILP